MRGECVSCSQKSFDCKIIRMEIDADCRAIFCMIEHDEMKILLCNSYAPNENSPEYFEKVTNKLKESFIDADIVMWGGDFNTHLSELDTKQKFKSSTSSEFNK